MGLIANLLKMSQRGGGGGGGRGGYGGGGYGRGRYGRGRQPDDPFEDAYDYLTKGSLKDLNEDVLSPDGPPDKDPQGWNALEDSLVQPEDVMASEALIGTSGDPSHWNQSINLLHGLVKPN